MSLCRYTHVINCTCTAARLQPHIDIYEISNIFCISLGQFKWLLKIYLFGGWDRGAL